MSTKVIKTDIAIVGGGIAGLSLGCLLGDAGLSVALCEPYPPKSLKDTPLSGRTIALMQTSLNVIKAIGIWDQIAEHCAPLRTMRLIDHTAPDRKNIQANFDADEIGMEEYGFNIPNTCLRNTLFKKAKKTKNLRLFAPDKLETFSVQNDHVLINLESGQAIKTNLIIGADGRNSKVRGITGIAASTHKYNQSAITCLINHAHSHNNVAAEFHRPSGPLAFVPLPGNQSSVVWVNTPERTEALLKLKKHEFEEALHTESKDVLGALTLETGPESWPLSSVTAKRLIGARTALIAEAAHVMSPITAQGLNLSLRDVAALAETIVDAARLGLDIGTQTILQQYEKRRRIDIASRTLGVDSMNRIVSNDVSFIKTIRRTALQTIERVPPLKRSAMRIGLAPNIDLGRLTKKSML